MGRPIRVLIVEDDDEDVVQVLRELARGGWEPEHDRVMTSEAMAVALRKPWDIILSDYSMPQFDAPTAFAMVKERGLDIPFIIVSGTIGEETAVEAMRSGVCDFIVKGRLARLLPAIDRELAEVAIRADRLRIQEQLMLSDRMASVGVLAAGVAHEINNPLAALAANVEFVAREVQSGAVADGALARLAADLAEPLGDARQAVDRIREIVRDLRVFSRADEERRGPVDVRHVLESSSRMVLNEIRHRANFVMELGDVPLVEANEARLGQVFLNLLVNAAHAIPEGRSDQNEIRIVTDTDELGRAVTEIRDTGSGMSPEVIAHMYDPFFTTKPIGVGTGLGLAICHRIVTAMGGEILVRSEVGKGTTFRVALPAMQQRAIAQTPVPPVAGAASARRARILVVDDERAIGRALTRLLSAHHDVQAVTSAQECLDLLAAGERYDVIVTDLMMPVMTGMDLHDELMRRSPEIVERMIFATGGAFTVRAREFLDTVPNPRIEKPFEVKALLRIISRLMD